MGAIADLDAYVVALRDAYKQLDVPIVYTTGGNRWMDGWTMIRPAGSAPGAAAVPAASVGGSVVYRQPDGANQLWLVGGAAVAPTAEGFWFVYDRLSHQSGLSGTVTTAQTTNLPTAALTRYTDGAGVMIGLQIYTAVGTTATTVTASYTNQDGTAGRTTPLVQFGGTTYRESERMILLPLQEGDSGVRSVESVDLTATTGTAGNFGVVLYRPLAFVAVENRAMGAQEANIINGGFPIVSEILPNACVVFARYGSGGNVNQQMVLYTAEV